MPYASIIQPKSTGQFISQIGLTILTCLATLGAQAQAPANDDCATALLLPAGASCINTVANTLTATASPAGVPTGTCSISNTPDVWYRVVVPASGTVGVTTNALAGSPTVSSILDAYAGTCGALTLLACDRATANGNPTFSSLTMRSLPVGSVVYVRARVNNGVTITTGRFNICAQDQAVVATRAGLAGSSLNVYPNPARQRFTLALPALGAVRLATVAVFNALGQVIQTETVPLAAAGTQAAIALNGVRPGLYSVRVQAGSETATAHLAVE